MDTVIVVTASYLIWVMVAGFGLWWLIGESRRGKVELAVAAAMGLVIVLVFLTIAADLYTNPRPFVADPSITPLISHEPDNGFPSNHAAAAGLIATLIVLRRWWWGLVLGLLAAFVAWGRVAAQVHHLLDVTVGLALGALAALLGILLTTWLLRGTRVLETPAARRLLGEPATGTESDRAPDGTVGTVDTDDTGDTGDTGDR